MQQVSGWSEQGGSVVTVPGTQGSGAQRFQQSFRGATVTVRDSSNNLATIYSDDLASPTAKANPFTASSTTGAWNFYVATGTYSVTFSGGSITAPFSITVNVGLGNAGGVPSYAYASLPTSKTQNAGDLARVTNNVRGLWMDTGVQFVQVGDFDVRNWGAKGDNTTDDTAAIQAAINAITSGTAGVGFYVTGAPPTLNIRNGVFLISSTLTIPNAIRIVGDGRWSTIIKAMPGFTGIMMQDKGNASKIIIQDLAFDAFGEAGVTDILNLGNLTTQFGTNMWLGRLRFRGSDPGAAISSCTGLRTSLNVGTCEDLDFENCGNGIVETANSVGTVYHGISVAGFSGYGMYLHHAEVSGLELEAPSAAAIGVYVLRQASIGKITYTQEAGVTNAYAIEIDSGCTAFSLDSFENIQGAGSVLTNLLLDNRTGYPTRWGDNGARPLMATGLSDELNVGGTVMTFRGMKFQNFVLQITNTAGTLQNRIGSQLDVATTGLYNDKITGASATLGNTPTGADASTAMAFGGKISSVSTNAYIFNVADQVFSTWNPAFAVVQFNTTTTPLLVLPTVSNRNVNGVTQRRLELFFYVAATGAAFALTTGNIGAGTYIDVNVWCYIK